MTIGVERGPHLDREGIRTDRAKWNLSMAALYEEAVKRQEGVIAVDHRAGHPAGADDLLAVVDVVQEGVQRPHPLLDATLLRLESIFARCPGGGGPS